MPLLIFGGFSLLGLVQLLINFGTSRQMAVASIKAASTKAPEGKLAADTSTTSTTAAKATPVSLSGESSHDRYTPVSLSGESSHDRYMTVT